MMKSLAASLLAVACATASAHDTWFRPLGGAGLLALGTGNRIPVHEFAVGPEHLLASGCRGARGESVKLTPVRLAPNALVMRAAPHAATCWARLAAAEVELTPDKVAIYLDEINAPPDVRSTWAGMQARGVVWKERYTKHARIELGAGSSLPTGMGMEIVRDAQDPMLYCVLREGRPLPELALELRGDGGQDGGWHRTDARGCVRVDAAAGRWLLRGTHLRASVGETWESDFVSLSFEGLSH